VNCGILSEGNIVQFNVEFGGSRGELVSDESGDQCSLSNQLTCIELSDDTFEDLIDNGRKNSFIIILSEGSIDGRQLIHTGT